MNLLKIFISVPLNVSAVEIFTVPLAKKKNKIKRMREKKNQKIQFATNEY